MPDSTAHYNGALSALDTLLSAIDEAHADETLPYWLYSKLHDAATSALTDVQALEPAEVDEAELARVIRVSLADYGAVGTVWAPGNPLPTDALWADDSDCPEYLASQIADQVLAPKDADETPLQLMPGGMDVAEALDRLTIRPEVSA